MTCPKCGFEQPAGAPDCARCGIVFAKWRPVATAAPSAPATPSPVSDAVAAWDAVAPPELEEQLEGIEDPLATVRIRPRKDIAAPQAPPNQVGLSTGHYEPPPAAKSGQAMTEVYDGRFALQPHPSEVDDEEPVLNGRIGSKELMILGGGLVAAVAAYIFPLTRIVLSALVTLFHEFGHAVVGWFLGMPSLPAFDFVYGGGWTHSGAFRLSLAILIAGGFAFLAYHFRQSPKAVMLIGVVFVFWLIFVSAEWRRELAFSAAGHAAEFILAGILFYQALAGVGWRSPTFERPLGAFVAFYVQINSTMFAWRLIHDADFLAWYKEGKGGAAMNDLEVVALDLNIYAKLNPGIVGVARMLLVFSFVPIAVALIWYFQRARWHRVMRSLRTVPA